MIYPHIRWLSYAAMFQEEHLHFLSAYSRRRTHFQLKASRSSSLVFLLYHKSLCFDFVLYALAFFLYWDDEVVK